MLFSDIPALATYDVFNPLRIPKSDPEAERVMLQALNRKPSGTNSKEESEKKRADGAKEVDGSMLGVAKTVWRLTKFSFQLSMPLTTVGFTLGCFAALQGLATGAVISWIQGASQVSLTGGLILTAAGVATSAAMFVTSSFMQFNNERFGWMSGIFLAKKLDRALMAQKFQDLDTEKLQAAISEVKQHQMRVNSLLFGLSSGVAGLVGVGLSYCAMAQHYPWLATGMVLATLPRFVVDYFLAPHVDEREREQAARLKKIEGAAKILSETSSARELMMHQREDWGQERRDGLLNASRLGRFNILRDMFWRQMFGSSTLIATGLLATAYPILDFLSNKLSSNSLPGVIGAGVSLTTSAFLVSSFWGQMLSNRLFIQRVLNFFDQGEKSPEPKKAGVASTAPAIVKPLYTFESDSTIELKDIRVSMPDGTEPILAFKELILKPGEVVGVVGERGQGKSTLLRLLMKQIEPSAGTISLHNVRARDGALVERIAATACNTREWLSMISKLYQDYPDLAGLTVAEAVHLGTQAHDSEDFVRLQEIVQLRNEILGNTSTGEETVIGAAEGGVNFSGGQRQGIAVLRSLLLGVNKPIMLLDEPGASSDPKNEQEMLSRIKELARNPDRPKVMVIVSHQYGTLTDADRIIVINNHTIEDVGTHTELLKQHGTYFSLWKKQTESLLPGFEVDVDQAGDPVFTRKQPNR